MVDIDDICAGADHVGNQCGCVAADMQLCQRAERMNVIDHPLFPLERELPVEIRPNLLTEGIADADAVGPGPHLSGNEIQRGFGDYLHRDMHGLGIVI